MSIFKLPDLGEGLPDAIIREWHIKPGDHVEVEQTVAAMETAKALVEVPSPIAGIVKTLHGKVGDTINTGDALISFVSDEAPAEVSASQEDQGTVVGKIATSNTVLEEAAVGIQTQIQTDRPKIIPAYRELAASFGLDISEINATGANHTITTEDFKIALLQHLKLNPSAGEKLTPAYRAMVQSMSQSHQQVVPVTLCDDIDINSWFKKQDVMTRLIQAICKACELEPRLNAQFDAKTERFNKRDDINIGIAVDSQKNGLFVPVLKQANTLSAKQIKSQLLDFKEKAETKSFSPDDLKDATIMLSNFGSIAGRYGIPILTPPCVAIIGAGRVAEKVVPYKKKSAIHPIMSLAITADHRVITGGELARFLEAVLISLS